MGPVPPTWLPTIHWSSEVRMAVAKTMLGGNLDTLGTCPHTQHLLTRVAQEPVTSQKWADPSSVCRTCWAGGHLSSHLHEHGGQHGAVGHRMSLFSPVLSVWFLIKSEKREHLLSSPPFILGCFKRLR